MPIKDYNVEREVLERCKNLARDLDVYEDLATDVMQTLIKYSVLSQDDLKMQRNRMQPKTAKNVLVVGGLGRMGQWMADFFDASGHFVKIYDSSDDSQNVQAYPIFSQLETAVHESDIIVLATPMAATDRVLRQLIPMAPKALIFDLCSLKSPVVDALKIANQKGLRVTSIHPMFGPNIDLLAGRNIIVCDIGCKNATDEVVELFRHTSANLLCIPLDQHDPMMSYVLGLSHITNLLFADVLSHANIPFERLKQVASTTFNAQLLVAMPVVNENQDLYFEIQASNVHTPALLLEFKKALEEYETIINGGDRAKFRAKMLIAKEFLNLGK